MAKPYKTSTDIVQSVERSISFPTSQATLNADDILAFANEEMDISQVPSVLQYHSGYYLTKKDVELQPNLNRYSIPNRAIGMKLSDIAYVDNQGIEYEMTQINLDDRSVFQSSQGMSSSALTRFYIEGNDIVLSNNVTGSVTGKLRFVFYIRPNRLVKQERASFCTGFKLQLRINNALITPGQTFILNGTQYEAVASSPTGLQFEIGVNSQTTATNIVNLINATDTNFSCSNLLGGSATITMAFNKQSLIRGYQKDGFTTFVQNSFSSTSQGIVFSNNLLVSFNSITSGVFTNGSLVDFLETEGGHRIRGYDAELISVSGTDMEFALTSVPFEFIRGDYACPQYECIIPYLPDDLHPGLIQRTCARVLTSIGDQAGMANVEKKIAEIQVREGNLVDNRVENAPLKVFNRFSLARIAKTGRFRRF